MGNKVEASPERLRNHLRRPDADEDQLIMKPSLTPLSTNRVNPAVSQVGVRTDDAEGVSDLRSSIAPLVDENGGGPVTSAHTGAGEPVGGV